MTVSECKQGLKEVLNILNPKITYSLQEVVTAIKEIHKDKTPEYRKIICSAYIGFAIGREYGFELGKNFVFDYIPE